MESVVVCNGCGRTIESAFFFCPWCGMNQQGEGGFRADALRQSMEKAFARMQELQSQNRASRIAKMKEILDALYDELSEI